MSSIQFRHPSATVTLVLSATLALAWTSPAAAQLRAQPYVGGFTQPIAFVQDPSNTALQYVVEQGGRIRVVNHGVVQPTDFLNITPDVKSGGEQGLLGLAFAPDYATSRRFYVNFTRNPDGHTVIARFRRSATNPLVADPQRFDLRWPDPLNLPNRLPYILQPYANHNGGHLAFGPDGFLYIGMGDGGSGNDPEHRAQTPTQLLGKMLRVDVSVDDQDQVGYRIPQGNPFGAPALSEIWAFGLRNPWKFSFDDRARGGTGALIIGDVGQNEWEEIDYEPRGMGGRNYGWRNREGAHAHLATPPAAYQPLTDPIIEYQHLTSPGGGPNRSVTGGYVYRGTALGPVFRGRYFFADFITGQIWSAGLSIDPSTGAAAVVNIVEHTSELGGLGVYGNPGAMGVDARGELYLVNYSGGTVLRITTAAQVPGDVSRRGDFDSDARGDLAVYTPSTGRWQVLNSFSKFTTSGQEQWGLPGDVPVPGDYDGDGQSELAVWRPSTGHWFVRFSSSGYSLATWQLYLWGLNGDVPVPADFDGDHRADLVLYRPSNGTWWVRFSSTGYQSAAAYQWGLSGDTPVTGDFDGDGRTELTVYRPTTGEWFIRFSSTGYSFQSATSYQWGIPGDQPLTADLDGDGRLELTVWRPSDATWYFRFSSSAYSLSTWTSHQWGLPGDVPIPADVDGDSRTDLMVWRPSNGRWYVRFSSDNFSYSTWTSYLLGTGTDVPLGR